MNLIRKLIKASGKILLLAVTASVIASCASISNKTLLGTPASEQWLQDNRYDRESIPALVKKQGKDFRILLFSDIQISFGGRVNKSLSMVDELVKEVQPDMIMTAGDNTSWIFAHKRTKQFIAMMEKYDIPWGVTLGNHDSEGAADRVWHGNRYEEAENSLFSSGPSNIQGIGNYSVNIEDEEGNIIYTLIMMDSNVEREYIEGTDYDYIHYDQIRWYKWLVNGINSSMNRAVPSMLFFHIPVPEFMDAYTALVNDEIDKSSSFGWNREGVCCAPANTGLFDTAFELGSTTHIFCGHDHVNNLSVIWKGIRLSYGLKTGPSSYSDDDMHGATLITIKDGSNEVVVEHLYR